MAELTLEERINKYQETFEDYPLKFVRNIITGVWHCPQARGQKFYGMYPLTYLDRVRALFPDYSDALHLFSGIVVKKPGETTFDCNPELKPDVVGWVKDIKTHFKENQFGLVIADPPYTKGDFNKYGLEPFNIAEVMDDVWHICRDYLVLLELRIPPFGDKWRLVGCIPVVTAVDNLVRVATIFTKQKEADMEKAHIEQYQKTVAEIERIMGFQIEFKRVFGPKSEGNIRKALEVMKSQMGDLARDREVTASSEDKMCVRDAVNIFHVIAVNDPIVPLFRDLSRCYLRLAFNWNKELGKRPDIEIKLLTTQRIIGGQTTLLEAIDVLKTLVKRAESVTRHTPPAFEHSAHYLETLRKK